MKLTTLFVALAATSTMTIATAGDDCVTPDAIVGQGAFPFDSSLATTGVEGQAEAICLFFGSSAVASDIWIEWTADADGDATISTCGTAHDTKIAAYPSGGCPVAGTSLACNDDSCGLQSSMGGVAVTNGTTYLLQIGSFPGSAGGAGALNISILAGPFPGDDCAAPLAIAGQGAFPFDSSLATTGVEGQAEAICLFFGSSAVASDIWIEWTADADGDATISTCGTAHDTKIAAYPSGGCPVAGTSLACNDDSCGLQSSMGGVAVSNGTTYLLQIGSFPGSAGGAGALNISISPLTTGTPYCFCDGGGVVPVCGNLGAAGNGCGNSMTAAGAHLDAVGNATVGADTVVLTASDIPPNQPVLIFQGDTAVALPFGDGIQCAGGLLVRLGISVSATTSADTASMGVVVSVKGGVTAGDLKRYQAYYRDGASACAARFNTTNGYEIQW